MMKGLLFQQQQGVLLDENMSNLTSASGEAVSVSSGNRIEIGAQQKYFVNTATAPQNTQPAVKKRRNLPGNPDPDAEIIALSPKTLMATNRFICEICNKGFQRDQNLQLHRRGHNLPWKLKQRSNKEVIRKKVYVCPEPSCVHHDPSRALGDLTGIKKHFFRKHGEKKWKCDKCSKKYAVQSDWKAHSKTCGTREYRCDCGTLFSRRDSFITHRAFCDALAEESARAISANPLLSHQQNPNNIAAPTGIINSSALSHLNNFQTAQFVNNNKNPHQNLHTIFPLKNEQQNFNLSPEIPPWLSSSSSSSIFSTRLDQNFTQTHLDNLAIHHHQDPNPNLNPNNNSRSVGPTLIPYQPTISAHMSATALLQKAAQMGATISSNKSSTCSLPAMHRPHQVHMSDNSGKNSNNSSSGNFGFNNNNNNMCSREEMASTGFVVHNLAAFGNKASASATTIGATSSSNVITTAASGVPVSSSSSSSLLLHDMVNSLSSGTGFEGTTSFEDYAFGGILNSNKDLNETLSIKTTCSKNDYQSTSGGGGNNNIGEGLTRDFLGLRSLSQSDILNIAALGNCINTTRNLQNQPQKPWQG